MSLTEIAIKRPSLIIVIFSVLILGGIFCYTQLSYELLPDFSQPSLTISTVYTGASPSDVEQSVTKKLEDVLSGLDGIKDITSQSSEGNSTITAEFNSGVNIDDKQQDAQRKINNILSDLPDNVKTPSISKVSPSDQPIMQLSATSNLSDAAFYDLLNDKVEPLLQQIEGIGTISILGAQPREIQVNVDQSKLDYYNLSLLNVTLVIKNANSDFPTGDVKTRSQELTVRLGGKFSSVDQIRNLVVATDTNGSSVRISDIATVADVVKEQTSINRLNGKNGIGLVIKKQNNANAVQISREVKKRIAQVESTYASTNLKITIADDTSDFTIAAADAVEKDLIIAIILVAVIMLLFLHSTRDSLMVLIAIPASLISTFIAMYLFGYSLNLMTLLAMSLVIGILVDDSIVVLENIHRHLAMGKDKVQAAIDGRSEIGFSAIAITMVDVVVFLPIALISTTIGALLRQYAVTIVVSTLMSLFVCFTLTPLLASRFGKVTILSKDNLFQRFLLWFESLLERLTKWYGGALKWVLFHKALFGAIVIVIFIASMLTLKLGILGQELVASSDEGKFQVSLEYDKSTTITENNLRSMQVEDYLLKQQPVKDVFANIAGADPTAPGGLGSDYKSTLTIKLVDKKDRSVSTDAYLLQAKDSLVKRFPGIKINTTIQGTAGGSDPIQLILTGDNEDTLIRYAQKLKGTIAAMPGSNNVYVTVEDGNPEVNVQIDREKMARFGLNIYNVGATLQNAYTGNTDAKYEVGVDDYDINVRLDEFDRKNPSDVANISFLNNSNQLVRLSQFATIVQSSGPSLLERYNRRASVTIHSNVLGITSGVLSQNIDKELTKNPLPKSIQSIWSGDISKQTDSFGALGIALLSAFILIYLVMVALYDNFIYPVVVLFTIPLALIGAVLALNLAEGSFSIFTMLGIIMLFGLVMKNGILIVDFANHLKEKGYNTFDALIEAGEERLRPILMTTTAMVIGMLPIALDKGAGAEWKNGLGIVMIGGLLSSLMLTIFVIPMMYYIVDAIKDRINTWKHKKNTVPLQVAKAL
jgi:HAE1 family hydrophobic/amphiphilic exporter-1